MRFSDPQFGHDNDRQLSRQNSGMVSIIDVDEAKQLVHSQTSGGFTSIAMRQLRGVISRFCSEDQDTIYRAFSTLLSWALESLNGGHDVEEHAMATNLNPDARMVGTVLSLACTFLVLFMIWKLSSITRPVQWARDCVIVVGFCDEVYILDSDVFSTWEVRFLGYFDSTNPDAYRLRTRMRIFFVPFRAVLGRRMWRGGIMD